jgi:hypothetical protein
VRVGVLGCAPISQFARFETLRKAHNAELYAICDVAEVLAEQMTRPRSFDGSRPNARTVSQ